MTVTIVASTPAWNEPEALLERSHASVAGVVDWHNVYPGGVRALTGGPWVNQSAMREHGRVRALEWAADHRRRPRGDVWFLQLDADELLVHGERLRPILERWPHAAFPIPLVQESGDTTLAPFKLFRARDAKIVACSEYVRLGQGRAGTLYNLAGYMLPPEVPRDALLDAWPFLFHTPSARGPGIRAGARLSLEELSVETRPDDAIQWPLPPLTLNGRSQTMAEVDAGGSVVEYDAGDGDYACPECGKRYDTPGLCTGHDEAGHPAVAVEAVKGSGGSDGPSKDELKAQAAELGLELPAKATKDQIAAAIAEHEAQAAAAGA